jgi:SAM-dependent methyltransferase
VLDVGCGYGFFSAAAAKRGFAVDSIEVAPLERKIAEELFKIRPIQSGFEEFIAPRSYDGIILSQVLEHAREPVKWIRKSHDLLNEKGVVAIALPNFGSIFTDALKERDPYVIPPAHLNYFSSRSLSGLVERNGFEVLQVETFTRIPRRSFDRRVGKMLGGLAHSICSVGFRSLDVFLKGNMLNLYARRR